MAGGYGGGGSGYGGYPQQQPGYGGGWNGYQQPQQGGFNPYQQGGYQQAYQQPAAYASYGQEAQGYDQQYSMGYAGQAQAAAPMAGPGWSEEWDPTSQRCYYFNRTTGVTQWEKPAELM
jgi:far upstream element-binding protein